MSTWGDFERAAPELASLGGERFRRDHLAWLATLRSSGAPRVHPVSPIIAGGGLFVFMEPTSPKVRDLRRDDRYALHAHVPDILGTAHGEYSFHGVSTERTDHASRQVAAAASLVPPEDRYVLFELMVHGALGTDGQDAPPRWLRWPAVPS